MDDTAQKLNNLNNQTDQTQPVQPAQKITDKTQQPVQPVSSIRKEGQPVISHESFVMPSEVEPKLHPEVSNAGVEVVSQNPELTKEQQDLGIKPSLESVKPNTQQPTGIVKITPLTEDQADEVINAQKHDSAIAEHTEGIYRTNSIYGLAVLVKKIIKEMHKRLIGQPA